METRTASSLREFTSSLWVVLHAAFVDPSDGSTNSVSIAGQSVLLWRIWTMGNHLYHVGSALGQELMSCPKGGRSVQLHRVMWNGGCDTFLIWSALTWGISVAHIMSSLCHVSVLCTLWALVIGPSFTWEVLQLFRIRCPPRSWTLLPAVHELLLSRYILLATGMQQMVVCMVREL